MVFESIYVMPTEEGKPPRAVIGSQAVDGFVGLAMTYVIDDSKWIFDHDGSDVPEDIAEVTTLHAQRLGVPTFAE